MEQRAVTRFFTLKNSFSCAIATEFESVYGADAFALPTVTQWHKRFSQRRTSLCDNPRSTRPVANGLAEAITLVLEEHPFLSGRLFCQHFVSGKTSCLRILDDNVRMKKLNL
jgi:hypothetical protein